MEGRGSWRGRRVRLEVERVRAKVVEERWKESE